MEVKQRLALYSKFLRKENTILDIGCGDGFPAFVIKQTFPNITCLEKKAETVKKEYDHTVIEANAEKIPFGENDFDVSLLFYVLHHSDNPKHVLKEAARVTSKHIIIVEEFYKSSLNRALMVAYDIIINLALYPDEKLVPNFLKEEQLSQFAGEFGLHLVKEHTYKRKWYRPPHKKLLVFEKR